MIPLIFMGTGPFAAIVLRGIAAAGHSILRVVVHPEKPSGRGLTVVKSPVRALAEEFSLPLVETADVNAADLDTLSAGATLAVVVDFGQKISAEVLRAFPRGCVNVHCSLLPRHRGAAPFQWALISGDVETGVTVFQLDERWDAGPIWGQRSIPIREDETAAELRDRLAQLGASLLVELLPNIAGGEAAPIPQPTHLATRAPKLKKSDGTIDWSAPAKTILRRVHGLWPWPAATCDYVPQSGQKRISAKLARASIADEHRLPRAESPPGTILMDGSIQCGIGALRIEEIQPSGGKLMAYRDFANGRRVQQGDRFETSAPDSA